MKRHKLIARLRALMSGPADRTPRRKICQALRQLKQKQRELEARLEQVEGQHARQRLKQKIEVLRAQRIKGQQRYREIKKAAAS